MEPQIEPMAIRQEKPVATPGNVPDDSSEARHVQLNALLQPITRHVLDGDAVRPVQLEPDHADRRVEPVRSGPDADRKSTRLNSSHLGISYAVLRLKKKQDRLI